MNPLHPKLREALLKDETHRKNGLTPAKLREYDLLTGQLNYTFNYPEKEMPLDPQSYGLQFNMNAEVVRRLAEAGVDCSVLKGLERLYEDEDDKNRIFYEKGELESELKRVLGFDVKSPTAFRNNDYLCNRDRIFEEAEIDVPLNPVSYGPKEDDIRVKIKEFQGKYMPRYPEIHADWVAGQAQILERAQLEVSPFKNIGKSIALSIVMIYRFSWLPISRAFRWKPKTASTHLGPATDPAAMTGMFKGMYDFFNVKEK